MYALTKATSVANFNVVQAKVLSKFQELQPDGINCYHACCKGAAACIEGVVQRCYGLAIALIQRISLGSQRCPELGTYMWRTLLLAHFASAELNLLMASSMSHHCLPLIHWPWVWQDQLLPWV